MNSILIHVLTCVHINCFFLCFPTFAFGTFMECNNLFLWKIYVYFYLSMYSICFHIRYSNTNSYHLLWHCLAYSRHLVFAELQKRKDEHKKTQKTVICFVIYRKQLCQTVIILRNNSSWAQARPPKGSLPVSFLVSVALDLCELFHNLYYVSFICYIKSML